MSFNMMARSVADGTRVLIPRATTNTGSHQGTGSSISAMVSTLIPVLVISIIVFTAFLLLQKKFERVYGPRTYLNSLYPWQKTPERSPGLFGWRNQYSQLADTHVLGHSSIDNYLWLRFWKTLIIMCFVGCLITWPILFPVNATGPDKSAVGLDILSFSRLEPGTRYYASCLVSWVFLGFVMFLITRESRFAVRLRQQTLLSPFEKSRISNRTVLFVNVPEQARNEEYLRNEYPGVRHVWLVSVPEDLADKAEERDNAAAKLDSGETGLLKNHIKRENKRAKKEAKGKPVEPRKVEEGREHLIYVEEEDRPTHRLPKLKFLPIGKKVNTIDWSRGELRRLIPEVASGQKQFRDDKSNVQGACFIEFDTVHSAHNAIVQAGLKNKVKMTPKDYGTTPDNVIWKNVVKSYKSVMIWNILCTAFVWWLCIFWTIPVAVIGAISNINYLTDKVHFLSFINDIPKVVLGVVTGLLPVVLLSILMSLVPIIMNILAKRFEPTQTAVQMKVQSWYFPFQVIQVFIVTTLSSGASSVVTQIISKPMTATTLLASNLPKASNFYISYFILFGLNSTAMLFLNIAPLAMIYIVGKFLDKTPRKMYNRWLNLGGLGWGALYPAFTNLGVIALAYSCISPLLLGFATVGFSLLYAAHRYLAIFTIGTVVPTHGKAFSRALQQLTTGIYISEVCLLGLYAIGVNSSKQSIGPLVLEIVLLVFTILWHVWLNRSLKKMATVLPDSGIGEEIAQNHKDLESSPVDASGNPVADAEKNGNGEYTKASHSFDGRNDSIVKKPTGDNIDNPNKGRGFLKRVEGFFLPSAAATNAVWSISPHFIEPVREYTAKERDEAYIHPALTSESPMIWIPRDKFGLSRQEVEASRQEVGEGLEMTDEGATIDDKGKIEWGNDDPKRAPIWEDPVVY